MSNEARTVGRGGISLWQDAYRRLRRDTLAVVCFLVLVAYVLVALMAKAGVLVNHLHGEGVVGDSTKAVADAVLFADYDDANPEESNLPPPWAPEFVKPERKAEPVVPEGPPSEPETAEARNRYHVFGTNIQGKDVLSLIANGAGISITLGLAVAAFAVIVGAAFGALAGWFGRWADEGIVWLYSTISSVPDIMLIVAIAFMFEFGFVAMFVAMGFTYWVSVARVVRGEFMKLKERDYVLAARALGLGNFRIMVQHVLPNVAHLLIISFSLLFVSAIKAEVVLSFLGVGITNEPSWGLIIQDAETELMRGLWWQITFVSVALFGIVLALQVFTDALRDALDPRLRQ